MMFSKGEKRGEKTERKTGEEGRRTDEEALAPWEAEGFPLEPCFREGTDPLGRHG